MPAVFHGHNGPKAIHRVGVSNDDLWHGPARKGDRGAMGNRAGHNVGAGSGRHAQISAATPIFTCSSKTNWPNLHGKETALAVHERLLSRSIADTFDPGPTLLAGCVIFSD